MSFHFQALQAVFNREASESNGTNAGGAVACERFNVAWEAPQDGGAGIIAPIPSLSCVEICSTWANPQGQAVSDPGNMQAQSDDAQWLLLLSAVPPIVDNIVPALQDRVIVDSGPGFAPVVLKTPALRLDGPALAMFTVAPSAVDGYVMYRAQGGARRVSNATFGTYADTAQDTLPSIEQLLLTTEQQFVQGTARTPLGVTSSGETLYVNDCGAAYSDPCGCVYITAADVGNSNEQIPVDLASNSAAHYRFHPSVFFRRAQAVRAILSLEATNTQSITQDLGNLTIFEILRAPTHSRWSFIVDGAEMDVIVAHPVGSDLRRPRDIWNSVIVAALLQANADGSALTTFEADTSTGPRLFIPADLIKRMEYLQYARFIEVLDDDVTPITTAIPQTTPGGAPPPPPP